MSFPLNGEIKLKEKSVMGFIHSTESFGSVDGPGVRFVIFMQGCRMRCQFCHNPDTWSLRGGEPVSADAMFDRAMKYQAYWGPKGGITVSGGEPLLQMDFLIELFARAKAAGVHTCIDTAGQPFTGQEPFLGKFKTLMKLTDLLLLDLKHIDEAGHKALTGAANANILAMARFLAETGKPVWIRHVLVPGRNDDPAVLARLDEFVKSLGNVRRFEVLPYHTMGLYKWEELRIPYPLAGVDPPSKERVEQANRLLHTADYRGYLDD